MTDPLDRAIAALNARPVPPGPPPELVAATAAAMTAADPSTLHRKRRMKFLRALGATAALAAAVAVAIVLGTGSSASALQVAVRKAKEAKSVKLVSTLAVEHPAFEPQVSTHYYQGTKLRVEENGRVRIADYGVNRGVFLYPEAKYAWRLANTGKFDLPLVHFNRFHALPRERDGTDDVGGVKADRYKVTPADKDTPGRPAEYRVWVDPESGWPVKVEGRGKLDLTDALGKGSPPADYTITDDRFEWDAALEAELFRLDVPAGYEAGDEPWELRALRKK